MSTQVREQLGLSYGNVRALHQKVDSLPDHAGPWKVKTLSFPDRPDEKFLVHHRDIISAIRALWGDPSLAQHLVYRPKKVFSDQDRKNRIYSEMWTGSWWHVVQVCLFYAVYEWCEDSTYKSQVFA